ncbi:MAG: cell division protein FtsB [Gammaproteobacteria bacterium]|nr:MAG: cell division protein FtsB [Gammaproteobacteria bacterium]
MRIATIVLALLFVALQYRLWVGEGSLAEVRQLSRQVEAQKTRNQSLRSRNAALRAEVDDLKSGLAAIEERARSELGMIREGEHFYQVIEPEETGTQ